MTPAFIDLPIVLAPMGGAGTVALTVAVANAGGFAIHPCAYTSPEQTAREIAEIRAATTRPFGVNLFVETQPYTRDER
ncbi:MAG: nitronate monooxygenase, partial [Candidatus Eremiobacteraeota bacterium]|nr:nitronate monooxygenase [Candidatus Eremiobacteraeota bacterium]